MTDLRAGRELDTAWALGHYWWMPASGYGSGGSARGAAPLPRIDEAFSDARGDSRTMRLSWYSGTGIAVFSIWQGASCTGTFRLAMDDLPRLISLLERGPREDTAAGAPTGSHEPHEPVNRPPPDSFPYGPPPAE